MALLKTGDPAPALTLESDSGEWVSLRGLRGSWVVLYFYPRDNTPGCTREAQEFGKALAELKRLGATVLGVSKDGIASHGSFRDKLGIRFPLLSDPDLAAQEAYGVWGTKVLYGRKFKGTIRSTFLISPSGKIAAMWSGVRVPGHAQAVLEALKTAQGGPGLDLDAPKKKTPRR